MTTRNILELLPDVEKHNEMFCDGLAITLETTKSWRRNFEDNDIDFQDSVKREATQLHQEIERTNICIEKLLEIKEKLEKCEDIIDEIVYAEYNPPELKQLTARVIKENPGLFKALPEHFSQFSYLDENIDSFRTKRKVRKGHVKKSSKIWKR